MLQKRLFILVCLLLCLSPIAVHGQDTPQYHEIAQIGRPSIKAIDWNPKQDLIAVATEKDIWLYDTQLKDVAHLDLEPVINLKQWDAQQVTRWGINSVKWSPDGRWLTIRIFISVAHGNAQPDLWQIWDWNGSEFSQVMPNQFPVISKIAWSSNANQYAILAVNKVYLFDSANNTHLFSADATDFSWNNGGTAIALMKREAIEIIDAQNQQKIISLSADETGYTDTIWSPDDTKIGAINNNRLLVWDVKTGKQLSVFLSEVPDSTQYGSANPIALSKHTHHTTLQFQTPLPQKMLRETIVVWVWLPDSKQVVVSYGHPIFHSSGHITIYDIQTGKAIYEPTERDVVTDKITPIQQGNVLITHAYASSGYPATIVWNIKTHETMSQSFSDTSWMQSPNAQLLASFDLNHPGIRISDINTFNEIFSSNPTIDRIRNAAWHPENKQIAIVSGDEIQIWDMQTHQIVADNLKHNGNFSSVIGWNKSEKDFAIRSAGPYFRFGYNCPSIRIWDTNTWLPTTALYDTTGVVWDTKWGLYTDQLLMVKSVESSCGTPPSITTWNKLGGKTLNLKNDLGLNNLTWAENDTTFSGSNSANWYLFDSKTGQIIRTITFPQTVSHVEWIPHNNLLIANSYNAYSLDFIDASTGNLLYSIPDVQSFSLAHHQTTIANFYTNGKLEIGSVTRTGDKISYQSIKTVATNSNYLGMWWNPQDTTIATMELTTAIPNKPQNLSLQIRDLDHLDIPQTIIDNLAFGEGSISSFAWHPDGKSFATSQNGGIVKIWSLNN